MNKMEAGGVHRLLFLLMSYVFLCDLDDKSVFRVQHNN